MAEKTLDRADLAQFTGSERWFRHTLNPTMLYTEGAQYVAEHGGAYWLLDTIALSQLRPEVKAEEFQAWKLKVVNSTGVLVCEDGDYNVVYRSEIPFTNFPLDGIELWVENDTIYLPSEH